MMPKQMFYTLYIFSHSFRTFQQKMIRATFYLGKKLQGKKSCTQHDERIVRF